MPRLKKLLLTVETSPALITALSNAYDRQLHYEVDVTRNNDVPPAQFSATLRIEGGNLFVNVDPELEETIVSARYIGDGYAHDSGAVGEVLVTKKKLELLSYLQFINPQIQDIAVNGSRTFLDIGLDKMLPINMFGSGMVRACSVMAYCLLGANRILLIDEISSGLHYKAMSLFLKTILRFSIQENTQVFVTTHSLGVLRSLREILGSDDMADAQEALVCYALQRDRTGLVRGYRYSYSNLNHCIRHNIEIR